MIWSARSRVVVGSIALAACGHRDHDQPAVELRGACAAETRADAYVAGLAKPGTRGAIDFTLVTADPGPPARGDNAWHVQLRATSPGHAAEPITGAAITATPFMPDHQHGSPVKVQVTPTSKPGEYVLSPINLWMPGYWETTIQASSGSASDAAVFKFCIAR